MREGRYPLRGAIVGNPSGLHTDEWGYSYTTFMRQHGLLDDAAYQNPTRLCDSHTLRSRRSSPAPRRSRPSRRQITSGSTLTIS